MHPDACLPKEGLNKSLYIHPIKGDDLRKTAQGPLYENKGHICSVSGPPREKVRRLVSSAVFQDPEMWRRWRRNDKMG